MQHVYYGAVSPETETGELCFRHDRDFSNIVKGNGIPFNPAVMEGGTVVVLHPLQIRGTPSLGEP